MSRSFAITLHRPHESFGFSLPLARRIGAFSINQKWWTIFFCGLTLGCIGFYIFLVNAGAPKSFALQNLSRQLTRLQETTSALDDQLVELGSMSQIKARVEGLGYVPVDQVEYIDLTPAAVAMAR
jgi:hypothetical protein